MIAERFWTQCAEFQKCVEGCKILGKIANFAPWWQTGYSIFNSNKKIANIWGILHKLFNQLYFCFKSIYFSIYQLISLICLLQNITCLVWFAMFHIKLLILGMYVFSLIQNNLKRYVGMPIKFSEEKQDNLIAQKFQDQRKSNLPHIGRSMVSRMLTLLIIRIVSGSNYAKCWSSLVIIRTSNYVHFSTNIQNYRKTYFSEQNLEFVGR